MTLDEFDVRNWVNGMTCFYDGHHRMIVSVDFTERLIGLRDMTDEDAVDLVRCENVAAVTYPSPANERARR